MIEVDVLERRPLLRRHRAEEEMRVSRAGGRTAREAIDRLKSTVPLDLEIARIGDEDGRMGPASRPMGFPLTSSS